jgi:hypothetical protein
MKALPTDRHRQFVRAMYMVKPGHGAAVRAAKLAGFGTPESTPQSMATIASRLVHDKRVQEAFAEQDQLYIRASAPRAIRALSALIENPGARDHARGIAMVLDRVHPAEQIHKVDHLHTHDVTPSAANTADRGTVREVQRRKPGDKACRTDHRGRGHPDFATERAMIISSELISIAVAKRYLARLSTDPEWQRMTLQILDAMDKLTRNDNGLTHAAIAAIAPACDRFIELHDEIMKLVPERAAPFDMEQRCNDYMPAWKVFNNPDTFSAFVSLNPSLREASMLCSRYGERAA